MDSMTRYFRNRALINATVRPEVFYGIVYILLLILS